MAYFTNQNGGETVRVLPGKKESVYVLALHYYMLNKVFMVYPMLNSILLGKNCCVAKKSLKILSPHQKFLRTN